MLQNWVYLIALIMGSLSLLSTCYVWIKQQKFGTGGSVLSLVGVILIGLSVWSKASIQVSPDGLVAEFERMQKKQQELIAANNVLSSSLQATVETAETNKKQYLALLKDLETRQVVSSQRTRELEIPFSALPEINRQAIQSSRISTRNNQ